jgi:hypothetical protein
MTNAGQGPKLQRQQNADKSRTERASPIGALSTVSVWDDSLPHAV